MVTIYIYTRCAVAAGAVAAAAGHAVAEVAVAATAGHAVAAGTGVAAAAGRVAEVAVAASVALDKTAAASPWRRIAPEALQTCRAEPP